MACDYFSKYIEGEAVVRITEVAVRKFLWTNIITRYGIPQVVVFDHGRQFWNDLIQAWLGNFETRIAYFAVYHPQSNGQAEAANKQVLNGLKKKVEHLKGKWVDELASVLWSLRTTVKESTRHTPFSLVYGTEAVLLTEMIVHTIYIGVFDQEANEEAMKLSLDLIDEKRDAARDNLAIYQNRMKRVYNRSVHERLLYPGDLVLRKASYQQGGKDSTSSRRPWDRTHSS